MCRWPETQASSCGRLRHGGRSRPGAGVSVGVASGELSGLIPATSRREMSSRRVEQFTEQAGRGGDLLGQAGAVPASCHCVPGAAGRPRTATGRAGVAASRGWPRLESGSWPCWPVPPVVSALRVSECRLAVPGPRAWLPAGLPVRLGHLGHRPNLAADQHRDWRAARQHQRGPRVSSQDIRYASWQAGSLGDAVGVEQIGEAGDRRQAMPAACHG